MGGQGSGRFSDRPSIESGLALSLPRLRRDGLVRPGRVFRGELEWVSMGSPEHRPKIWLEAHCRDPYDALLCLQYEHSGVPVYLQVPLATTKPNFGGFRWWLVCPITARRAQILYLPAGRGRHFAHRTFWGLGYDLQRLSGMSLSLERAHRFRAKLDGMSPGDCEPQRPKGMWQRTYERRLRKWALLERRLGKYEAALASKVREAGGW
jgi:hypothetical protein